MDPLITTCRNVLALSSGAVPAAAFAGPKDLMTRTAARGAAIGKLPLEAAMTALPVPLDLECQLTAPDPVADRPADRSSI